MQYRSHRIYFALASIFLANTGVSVPLNQEEQRSIHILNMYTNGEAAACLGSLGAEMGIGIRNIEGRANRNIINKLNVENGASDDVTSTHFIANKGLSLPVDLGISVTRMQGNVSQAGGHLKWTIFQRFQLPAIATRITFNKMWGLESIESNQVSGGIMASYSPIRYLQLSFTISRSWQNTTYEDNLKDTAYTNSANITTSGLKLWIIPSTFSILLEQNKIYDQTTYFARISLNS